MAGCGAQLEQKKKRRLLLAVSRPLPSSVHTNHRAWRRRVDARTKTPSPPTTPARRPEITLQEGEGSAGQDASRGLGTAAAATAAAAPLCSRIDECERGGCPGRPSRR